ncbi:hypothetical protein IFR05_005954 [Cadophora sp. M221]|nr:hypothetical protein IFR05_005954 [Cadophora sp. M221]
MVWDLRDQVSPNDMEVVECPDLDIAAIRRDGVVKYFRYVIHPQCNCVECAQQFRTVDAQKNKTFGYREGLNDHEAKSRAAEFTNNITRDLQYLREQCTLNGNSILKRWKKKSKSERTNLLKLAMPNIFSNQWCDSLLHAEYMQAVEVESRKYGGMVDTDFTKGRYKRKYRERFLLPYVNLEALTTDPTKLLNLLYCRTKYSPEQWAPYDNFLLNGQWWQGAFDLTYNRGCVVMHGVNYGTWTQWETVNAHNWSIIGFPKAMLILETQQKLLGFLKEVVGKLVEGLSREDSSPQSNNFIEALEQGPKRLRVGNVQSTQFESPYLNQPFSAPPIFDIEALLSIAQTRLDMHGDHLWLLQTDPSFMRRYSEAVLAGGLSENLTKHNKPVYVTNHILQDETWFWSWEWIVEQLQILKKVQIRFRDSIQPGYALPKAYENSLSSLTAFLGEQFRRRANFIKALLPSRPGLRDSWKVEYKQVKQSMIEIPRRKDTTDIRNLFFDDRLEFCLHSMLFDPDDELLNTGNPHSTKGPEHQIENAFAMLDAHLANSAKNGKKTEVARIDEILFELLTDLAAVHQILSMVRLHVPRARKIDLTEGQKIGQGRAWRYVEKHFMEQTPYRFALPDRDGNLIELEKIHKRESPESKIAAEQRLGNLMRTFMASETPKGPRLTSKWAEQSAKQREALSAFWKAMRERHVQTLRRLDFDSEDIEYDLKVLSADTSSEYLASIEEERRQVLKALEASEAANEAKISKKAVAQTQWGDERASKVIIPGEKVKPKTRGTEQPNAALSLENLKINDPEPEPVIQAAVSKKSLSVFNIMFPSNNLEERSKSVDWDAFVNAMGEEEVGFVARHSAGGAAYTFEPSGTSKWAGKGKIVFHKPHPTPVLDSIVMSINGKRMRKWFGWSEESFVLKT